MNLVLISYVDLGFYARNTHCVRQASGKSYNANCVSILYISQLADHLANEINQGLCYVNVISTEKVFIKIFWNIYVVQNKKDYWSESLESSFQKKAVIPLKIFILRAR